MTFFMAVNESVTLCLPDWALKPDAYSRSYPGPRHSVVLVGGRDLFEAAYISARNFPEVRPAVAPHTDVGFARMYLSKSIRSDRSELLNVELQNARLRALGSSVLYRAARLKQGIIIDRMPVRGIVNPADNPRVLFTLMNALAVSVAEFPCVDATVATFDRFNNAGQVIPAESGLTLELVINTGETHFASLPDAPINVLSLLKNN